MKLSDLIIEYRQRMNISQREFSRRCDLSNSYISFLEKGINPKTGRPIIPTIEQYKKLAEGMDISVNRLFELLDDDAPVDLRFPSSSDEYPEPKNNDVRLLIRGLNRLSPAQVEQAKNMMRIMFSDYAEYFEDSKEDNE